MFLKRFRARQQERVVAKAHAALDRKPGESITHVVVCYGGAGSLARLFPAWNPNLRWY